MAMHGFHRSGQVSELQQLAHQSKILPAAVPQHLPGHLETSRRGEMMMAAGAMCNTAGPVRPIISIWLTFEILITKARLSSNLQSNLQHNYPFTVESGDFIVADIFLKDFLLHFLRRQVYVLGESSTEKLHILRHFLLIEHGISPSAVPWPSSTIRSYFPICPAIYSGDSSKSRMTVQSRFS